jgi:DNA-directed RNA polymerase specialized sigma24 family protein
MPEAKHNARLMSYASIGDFHQIFQEENDSLYRLSFLLTADREKAQECLVSGLQAVKGSRVFKEWARSWTRRAIIQNAIRVINPRPMKEVAPWNFDGDGTTPAVGLAETAAVLQLEPFERFVYVMSVLEHYSDQDCSLLLGSARREVMAARIRALQQLEMRPILI